jgi:hypothetical protein
VTAPLALHLGLKWTYAGNAPAPAAIAKPPLVSPDAAHMEELMRLCAIGYIRGIEAKLNDLAKDEANQPFTEELRTHVAAFDVEGCMTFLHRFNEKVETIG